MNVLLDLCVGTIEETFRIFIVFFTSHYGNHNQTTLWIFLWKYHILLKRNYPLPKKKKLHMYDNCKVHLLELCLLICVWDCFNASCLFGN